MPPDCRCVLIQCTIDLMSPQPIPQMPAARLGQPVSAPTSLEAPPAADRRPLARRRPAPQLPSRQRRSSPRPAPNVTRRIPSVAGLRSFVRPSPPTPESTAAVRASVQPVEGGYPPPPLSHPELSQRTPRRSLPSYRRTQRVSSLPVP